MQLLIGERRRRDAQAVARQRQRGSVKRRILGQEMNGNACALLQINSMPAIPANSGKCCLEGPGEVIGVLPRERGGQGGQRQSGRRMLAGQALTPAAARHLLPFSTSPCLGNAAAGGADVCRAVIVVPVDRPEGHRPHPWRGLQYRWAQPRHQAVARMVGSAWQPGAAGAAALGGCEGR